MGKPIPVSELTGAAATAVRHAREGETTVITANGQPVAVIRPPTAAEEVAFTLGRGEPMAVLDPARKAFERVSLADRSIFTPGNGERVPPLDPLIQLRGESLSDTIVKARREGP